MKRFFNIAGPCIPEKHYMLSAIDRSPEIMDLIDSEQYFVIHAARQTGKTTFLHELMKQINKDGRYYALYCSLESVQSFTEPEEGIPEIAANIENELMYFSSELKQTFVEAVTGASLSTIIKKGLSAVCQKAEKPLIVFFDEIDCLSSGTLITFLRQLRDGYINRGRRIFVHSIALVGMRNIRDYKADIRGEEKTLGSASPFNIITESKTLKNFTQPEIASLYQQHTTDTGQEFTENAIKKAFYYSQGQPWLVNALAREAVIKILKKDFTQPITEVIVNQAAENIMLRRDTHIDSLLERLKENRVKNVIEPVILGDETKVDITSDDTQYCLDLGLLSEKDNILQPANPIYKEIIIRALSYDTQFALYSKIESKWISKTGQIDMNGLLQGFQDFWRENSEIWQEKYQYKEAAPHLILQAFLQRIINGGGHIQREYATGRRRIDLCVEYGNNRYPVELKLYYNERTMDNGLIQLSLYMDKLNEKTGWLVIFDRDDEKSWEEKIYWKTETVNEKTIHVVGC